MQINETILNTADSFTYYPLKKQRSLTLRPSTATTCDGDENAFDGPNCLSGLAAQIWLTLTVTTINSIIRGNANWFRN